MNEAPPIPESPPPPPLPGFKDRRTGLVVFGIVEILLGGLCLLFIGLMVLGQAMLSRTSPGAVNPQALLPALVIYLGLAATLVWLGIGSIQCRRWARALMLILAWCWLVVGLITVPLMGVVLPRVLASTGPKGQGFPPGVMIWIVLFQLLFMSLLLVALPAAFVFFYRSPHVKATCETRDPVRRWTDACPLPVLAVSCMLGLSTVMIASLPIAYRGTMPLFGTLVSGWAGAVVALGLAGLSVWMAQAWYRLKVSGWWTVVAAVLLMSISNFLTFSRVDIFEMYQKMGYSQAQMDLIRQQGILSSPMMAWSSVIWLVPMLGYLYWVKRFFPARTPHPIVPLTG